MRRRAFCAAVALPLAGCVGASEAEDSTDSEAIPTFAYSIDNRQDGGRCWFDYIIQFPEDSDYDRVVWESDYDTQTFEQTHHRRAVAERDTKITVYAVDTNSERSKLLADFRLNSECEAENAGKEES